MALYVESICLGAFRLIFQTVFLTKDYLECNMNEFVQAKIYEDETKK